MVFAKRKMLRNHFLSPNDFCKKEKRWEKFLSQNSFYFLFSQQVKMLRKISRFAVSFSKKINSIPFFLARRRRQNVFLLSFLITGEKVHKPFLPHLLARGRRQNFFFLSILVTGEKVLKSFWVWMVFAKKKNVEKNFWAKFLRQNGFAKKKNVEKTFWAKMVFTFCSRDR